MEQPEKLQRASSSALDEILGQQFPVLDNGFIRVIDYMGNDAAIVQAARVSYGKGTKHISEDRGLIRYLMRHRHTTPFEMCDIKLHVRVPMDTWRQWIRHRTASVNEYSTRYSQAIDEKQRTGPEQWRTQAKGNRQGSSGFLDEVVGADLTAEELRLHEYAQKVYQDRLELGVAREQARKDLPLSNYTEAYWKIDLHNLLHFLGLRMDSHAQLEIRSYADIIGNEIVSRWVPLTWSAFQDYGLQAMRLSKLEKQVIATISTGNLEAANDLAKSYGWLEKKEDKLKQNREREEIEMKLRALGIKIPWQ